VIDEDRIEADIVNRLTFILEIQRVARLSLILLDVEVVVLLLVRLLELLLDIWEGLYFPQADVFVLWCGGHVKYTIWHLKFILSKCEILNRVEMTAQTEFVWEKLSDLFSLVFSETGVAVDAAVVASDQEEKVLLTDCRNLKRLLEVFAEK
jgi:hypothetical protein